MNPTPFPAWCLESATEAEQNGHPTAAQLYRAAAEKWPQPKPTSPTLLLTWYSIKQKAQE